MKTLLMAPLGLACACLYALPSPAHAAMQNWTSAADTGAYEKGDISLIQAIAVAKRHVNGRAIHAYFKTAGGKGLFEVEIAANGALIDVAVNDKSDKVVDKTANGKTNSLPAADQAVMSDPVTLEAAAAQGDAVGDWSVDAGIEDSAGKPAYRVDVVKDGKLSTIAVDPKTGNRL
jgi:uncharacterized membrane protein YkoI